MTRAEKQAKYLESRGWVNNENNDPQPWADPTNDQTATLDSALTIQLARDAAERRRVMGEAYTRTIAAMVGANYSALAALASKDAAKDAAAWWDSQFKPDFADDPVTP